MSADVDSRSGTALEWDDSNDALLTHATTATTTIDGLTASTTYYFRIFAVDTYGNTVTVSSLSLMTPSAKTGSAASRPKPTPDITNLVVSQDDGATTNTLMEEQWTRVNWFTLGAIPNVNIYYSVDSGSTWLKLVGPIANLDNFDFVMPAGLGSTFMLRVVGTDLIINLDTETTIDLAIVLDSKTPQQALGIMRPVVGISPVTGLSQQITEVFPGDMIRSTSFPDIYFVTDEYERRVFLNQETYFTWFESLSDTKSVTDATLTSLPLVGRILPKPGVVLVKLQFAPEVFVIESNPDDAYRPHFRWITSEQVAKDLFGSEWAQYVMDIPFDGFKLFGIGEPISEAADYIADISQMKKRTTLHE